MHLTTLSSRLARLVLLGGMLFFTTPGYSMIAVTTGGMVAGSSGGSGGGIAIELWFVLMLALLGAAQWLDQKEATMAGHHARRASEDMHRWQNGR